MILLGLPERAAKLRGSSGVQAEAHSMTTDPSVCRPGAGNQSLSEHRAGSVRDYLVESGVNSNAVTAQGYGNTQPVATNDTSTGRQQNRRVELVVSGDVIGTSVNTTTGSLR